VSHHPLLKIGPIKQEQVSIDPPLWIYYDVITESQIERMINLSQNQVFFKF